MNDRAGRRRYRRTMARARRVAHAERPPRSRWPLLAEDECVLVPSNGWRCGRGDSKHTATARHLKLATLDYGALVESATSAMAMLSHGGQFVAVPYPLHDSENQ